MALSSVTSLLMVSFALAQGGDGLQDPFNRNGIEFFEQRIRPVLVEHCLKCHSAEAQQSKKLKGGLFLDSREGMLKGGESGAAVIPKKSAESLLMKALRYGDDVKMPPKGKLPDAVIADFARWIDMGAPDPRRSAGPTSRQVGMTIEAGRGFWSYRPLSRSAIPVPLSDWAANEIDGFIEAKLQAVGRKPAPDADRTTLLRRVYFDLVGLPPTPEAIVAFAGDNDPLAYERTVDRLLASPEFGERWGRHWLDVARYAESVTLRGFIFKEAWRYRDYVIESFNRDVPFDQFVREQIAGDLLPSQDPAETRRRLIATSFLALGNTNLEEQDKKQLRMDVVDEQLDAIGKGFLAQTITCARCHDHKFDPIPTRDYYAMAGILRNAKAMEHANVSQWIEMPLPESAPMEATLRNHERAVAALEERIKAEKAKSSKKMTAKAGVVAIEQLAGIVVDDGTAKKVGEWQVSQFSGSFIGSGYLHDKDAGKGEKTLTFQPELMQAGSYEVRLAYSPGANRAEAVPVTVLSADGEKTILVNMKSAPPIDGRFVSLGTYQFEKNGFGHVIVSNEGTKGHVTADAVVFLSPEKLDATTKRPESAGGAASPAGLKELEADLKRLQASGPKRQKAMTVVEEKQIEDCRVHIRGSVHTLGELAPRGFLQVVNKGSAVAFPPGQSGRLELAAWLSSPDNPLTSRVIVNRTWHWLFGSGIVRTVDNFGTTGESPSHPELLDYLASTFVEDGWSMKKLIRRIVLSRTYRLSSENRDETDPENKLFGRASRRRLEGECIRDAMLAISGQLSPDRGGPRFPTNLSADYGHVSHLNCRSVYLPMFRNSLPELLAVFDAADPSVTTGRRNISTAAPQALFLLNHSFPAEQARHAAVRMLAAKERDLDASIVRAYLMTVGRFPTSGERQVARRHLGEAPSVADWTGLLHALFASADFRFVN